MLQKQLPEHREQRGLRFSLRPVDDSDAGHTVLETMSPQAGHIIIHDFHLAPAEGWVLKKVQLVVRAILGAEVKGEWAFLHTGRILCP